MAHASQHSTDPAPRLSQQQMLQRIRAALGRTGPLAAAPTPPAIDDQLVRLTRADEDLLELFAQRAVEVGMELHRTTAAALSEALVGLLRELGAATAAVALDRLPQADALRQALADARVELVAWRNDRTMAPLYEVEVGVTDVHAALAETGSLICCSDAAHGRGLSLVPPTHIAIVRRSDILPDLMDYIASICDRAPAQLPSAQAIITGPSKTADIEGVLITGVHGPGRVLVLLATDA